jgi:hypothetical protein
MDKETKHEQQRPEFPQVMTQQSSRLRPRLDCEHLPIPPPLQTQPIPEALEPKLDPKYMNWSHEEKR